MSDDDLLRGNPQRGSYARLRSGPGLLTELVAALIPLVAGSSVAALFGMIVAAFTPIPFWVPVAVLLASAPLALWRPFEAFLVKLTPGTRHAIGVEVAQFAAALARVNARHRFPNRRWIFAVEENSNLNASTSGLHVLTLTRAALQLPEPLLDAVLAHELAHQAGRDTVAKAFRWWFLLPLWTFTRMIRLGAWGAVAFTILGVLHVIVAVLLTVLLFVVTVPMLLFLPVNAAIERRNELAADRYAALAGFKDELVALLVGFDDGTTPELTAWGRLVSTHPTTRARINALRAL